MLFFNKPLLFVPILKIYKNIIYQGGASGFNMFVMSIGGMLVLYFASMYGQEAVAGYGIGIRIEQIFLLPALGINTAILSIVSNNFGAKYFDRIEQSLYVALKYSFSISVIGLIVLVSFGHFLVSLFSNNPDVIQFAFMLIIVDAFTFFAYCSLFVGVALLQGIKQTKMIFYISLLRQTILPAYQ
jgi:Na+-driven multidrug efflux pump